jgi:hypothetical protein
MDHTAISIIVALGLYFCYNLISTAFVATGVLFNLHGLKRAFQSAVAMLFFFQICFEGILWINWRLFAVVQAFTALTVGSLFGLLLYSRQVLVKKLRSGAGASVSGSSKHIEKFKKQTTYLLVACMLGCLSQIAFAYLRATGPGGPPVYRQEDFGPISRSVSLGINNGILMLLTHVFKDPRKSIKVNPTTRASTINGSHLPSRSARTSAVHISIASKRTSNTNRHSLQVPGSTRTSPSSNSADSTAPGSSRASPSNRYVHGGAVLAT